MQDEINHDIPNPVAQQIIESRMENSVPANINSPKGLFRVDSPVTELKNRGIGYDKLSESQQQVLNEAMAFQTSHRPDDLYYFLKTDDYLPEKAVQSGLKSGITDICLNAPDTIGERGYSDDWKNALGRFKMQIGSLGLLSAETKTSVATDTVRAICDATVNNKDASTGEGHRTTKDIEFLVTLLVDKGDVVTLKQIESEISKTIEALNKTEEVDSWKPGQAKWLEENVIPKIQDRMKVPEAVPVA